MAGNGSRWKEANSAKNQSSFRKWFKFLNFRPGISRHGWAKMFWFEGIGPMPGVKRKWTGIPSHLFVADVNPEQMAS
jgi:hypothetical protein